jgi:hypothetical protein
MLKGATGENSREPRCIADQLLPRCSVSILKAGNTCIPGLLGGAALSNRFLATRKKLLGGMEIPAMKTVVAYHAQCDVFFPNMPEKSPRKHDSQFQHGPTVSGVVTMQLL